MEGDHMDRGKRQHKSQGTSRVESSNYIGEIRKDPSTDMIQHSTGEHLQSISCWFTLSLTYIISINDVFLGLGKYPSNRMFSNTLATFVDLDNTD